VSSDTGPAFVPASEYHARHSAAVRVTEASGFVWEIWGRCERCGYSGPVCDIILGIPPKRRLCAECAVKWVFGDE